ncbi:MAG: NAD(P)-dependent oxidoreductase [Pontiellaceae bacterium]|nr:NAD(P)-dependent oxidoreductase [Pontiellaceae bacterium]
MKQVFLTGAAGFIGSNIAARFAEEGWRVIALIHRNANPMLDQLAAEGKAVLLRGDLTNMPAIEQALRTEEQIDAIVHCAGRASDVGWRSAFQKTNLDPVPALADLTEHLQIPRMVFISTTDVYGLRDHHGEQEDELPMQAHPNNPYPVFKIKAEQSLRNTLPSERYAIIRPAQVWGAGDRTLTPRIVDFLKTSPWIVHFGKWKGRNRWPLAHVHNVALATFLATVDPGAGGQAINVVDNEHTSMDEFYRMLAAIYLPDKQFRTIALPFWTGQLIGGLISTLSNLLNLDRPFADPSYYALYSVSRNLDFGNRRMNELFARAERRVVTRAEGLDELKKAHDYLPQQ